MPTENTTKVRFEKIELTVVSVHGIGPSLLTKAHVGIQLGQQVHATREVKGMVRHVWNETFSFASTGSEELSFSLYRRKLFCKQVLMRKITLPIDTEPRNQDLVKTFPSSKIRQPVTITYRLQTTEEICSKGSGSGCPVFALIIGIDQYASDAILNLRGCVNDARTIKTFLTNRFHIPEDQIVFLANETATREALLDNFQMHLIENPAIEMNDAIIVYYAGHGSRTTAPEHWPAVDGKIETLVPHDERTTNTQGELTHGIPDRTLNTLLSMLATAKGNNITVILDCCHSGGLTRSASSQILPNSRYTETVLPIPPNLDRTLWAPRQGQVDLPAGICHKFMESHVLLAACRQRQQAREGLSAAGVPCGFFTDSLIKQLRAVGPNRITYSDLVELLPTLPDQTPQCEGTNKDRFIFDAASPPQDPKRFALTLDDNGDFVVRTGSIHGVVVGTQFVVVGNTPDEEASCVFVAESVGLDSSILIPLAPKADLVFPPETQVTVSDWNNEAMRMKVFVRVGDEPPFAKSDVSLEHMGTQFLVVDTIESADIIVARDAEDVFSIGHLDGKIPRYFPQGIRLNVGVHDLPSALDAVANFNYFLVKHNGSAPFGKEVALEMYSLSGEQGYRIPDQKVGNMVVENEVQFRLDRNAKYGFAIANHSKYDLFPYLFYFDPATYNIGAWYLPASRTMLAPLPAPNGAEPTRVTVGYGAGGGYAFQFALPAGLRSDTGFLKLFVSTTYMDLTQIEQAGATEAAGTRRPRVEAVDAELWDAWDIPVTMFTDY
ncbi:caspase domain-containing protein [Mycena rebaudengoi]|nr:caspase domain-containing protein [Mycena rebaudengoi]